MRNIDHLIDLMSKIFPDESCTGKTVAAYARRLALKVADRDDAHFAAIQPQETAQSGSYSPQKIAPSTAHSRTKDEPYATFKRMKKLVVRREDDWSYETDSAETFCKQGKFMQNFNDDCDQKYFPDRYYVTYAQMSDAQLRTYFTWRTKVRQGVVEETSLAYVFCYIFELLNDIGVANPADGMEKLLAIWTAYQQYDTHLGPAPCPWLRDYYVVHNAALTTAFSAYRARFPVPYFNEDVALLRAAKLCGWDDLRTIEASSSFKTTNGQFYKAGNQQLIEQCACFVIQALGTHFKRCGVDFRRLFVKNRRERCYSLFRNAIHSAVVMQPVVVPLDELETMKLNRNGWYWEYITLAQYRPAMGFILKCIEVEMRQHFGFKRSLQRPNLSVVENCFINSEPEKFVWGNRPTLDRLKVWKGKAYAVISDAGFMEAIRTAIADYCARAHLVMQDGVIHVVKPIALDFSKLKKIERDYIATAKKLIVEERQIPADPVPIVRPAPAAPAATGMAALLADLSAPGRALLLALVAGGQVPANSELLVEAINEKALAAIADNLIDYADGMPYVYDDYIDELRSSLGGKL